MYISLFCLNLINNLLEHPHQAIQNLVKFNLKCIFLDLTSHFFFFHMSTQEGEGEFELVTSASLGMVPTD
jgi:hypothetical protein